MSRTVMRLACLAAFAGFALAYYLWPTEERQILRAYDRMLGEIAKTGPEGLAAQGLKKLRIGENLGTNLIAEFEHPFPETMDREALLRIILYVRHQASRLEVNHHGATLSRVGQGQFEMETTVEAEIDSAARSDRYLGSFALTWEKQDGDWVITGGKQVHVIEHPAVP